MGKKSISKNYLYQLSYQILALIIPLITTPYISRVLGAEGIGIYSFTYSIATYFILFGSLGIAMYGQREIAYVQDKKEERSRIFWEIVILRLVLMTISATVFYFAYCTGEEYQLYYKILLIELFSNAIDISWFFQGLEEFKKTVTRNFIIKAAFTICIFIFVKSPADLTKYFFVAIGGNLLGNLSLWIYVPKYVQKIKIKSLKVFRHLKHTFFLFIPQIATQVYTILDKTMIGYIVADKSEVGYYEQAQKVINMLLTLVTSLGTVMVPRMANTFASGDKEQMKRYLQNSFKFTYTIAFPVMLGVIAVSANFVPIFFGEGYESVVPLINILAITILFIGMSNVTGTQLLLPTKRQKEFTISVTIGAIVNFVLKDGDILIPARGTTIKTAVFKEQQYPCIASSNLIVIRVNQNQILPIYLKMFLDSPLGVKQIKGLQQGTTLMNISYKDIMSVEIPMLPLEEQKVISEEYEKELSLYQNTINAANDRWQNVIRELQNKF